MCPNCTHVQLQPLLTTQGVEVDYCPRCHGVWLDPDEILSFSRQPRELQKQLDSAGEHPRETGLKSPIADASLYAIEYPGESRILVCPESGGAWLDASARAALKSAKPGAELDPDGRLARSIADNREPGSPESQVAKPQGVAGLLQLPNLVLRSVFTLTALYALLTLVLIYLVESNLIDVNTALISGVLFAAFQFIAGPFILDLTLNFLYKSRTIEPSELPDHLHDFVKRVCDARGMRFPRFRIIEDGAPQAFTYGHVPNNARIVLSQGTLDILEPEEVEAVVAHEIGHAVHWDMLVMTMAQLVPLVAYYIYRTLGERGSKKDKDNEENALQTVAVGAYVVYIVSEYIVLWLSRTREYHADRFAGEMTGNPSLLASALVKIAYGLAGQEPERDPETDEPSRTPKMAAVGALGIFDTKAAKGLAVASYAEISTKTKRRNAIKDAMRWDLWNPWARWYELNSTHPLVAHRLHYLGNQSIAMGQEPYIDFDLTQPESYWDEFLVDFVIAMLPMAVLASGLLVVIGPQFLAGERFLTMANLLQLAPWITAFGAALIVHYRFKYRGGEYPEMTVATLLKHVKVSNVRPVTCTLKGTVIGRGVPGFIFSEDFVMRDRTGIIFLDYRQPLVIWEWLFALLRGGDYTGKEVVVRGWYRRAPIPYVQLDRISLNGGVSRSWVPVLEQLVAVLLFLFGMALLLFPGLFV